MDNDNVLLKAGLDAYLADVFDAYRESGRLFKRSKNAEVKKSAQLIKSALDAGLPKLSKFGYHAPKRFEKLQKQWPDFD